MLKAIKEKSKNKRSKSPKSKKVQLTINQYELAVINRILKDPKNRDKHPNANVGKNPRILKIQKKNLEDLCKSLDLDCDEENLENLLLGLENLDFISFAKFD
jgi:hypothetical protein